MRKRGKIILFAVISLSTLIIGFPVFNKIMENKRIERQQKLEEREKRKVMETFATNSEEILSQLELLIDEGKFALAEKEINKYNIPLLIEVYPEIDLLKKRLYYAKLSLNMLTTSLDVLRRELEGKTKEEVRKIVGRPNRIQIFAGKKCWVYGNAYTSQDRGIVFHGNRVLTVTFY